jgi:cytochrome c oxidase subunit 4
MSSHPTSSPMPYFIVFAALLALTLTTYLLSGQELGAAEVPVALGIAGAKSVLVVLFFMHLLHFSRLTWLVVASGILFLAIMLALTLADYRTRDWLRETGATLSLLGLLARAAPRQLVLDLEDAHPPRIAPKRQYLQARERKAKQPARLEPGGRVEVLGLVGRERLDGGVRATIGQGAGADDAAA